MRLAQRFQNMQTIDRRIVYGALVVVLALPFLIEYTLPIYPDTYTRRFFDSIEQIADDPIVKKAYLGIEED